MKFLMNWLLTHFLFGSTLFFAAGATAIGDGAGTGSGDGGGSTDGGAGDGAGDGGSGDGADSGDMYEVGDDDTAGDGAGDDDAHKDDQHKDDEHADKEEPEVQEFKGSVSARLRKLAKEAPELAQVFQKYPKIQEQIEATFRREAALREVFPTVAEARQMREQFPNGLTDVQQLMTDVSEVEELDRDFYTKDRDGNYPGHSKIIENMFSDDQAATVSLFRSLPKTWHKLDPNSYNEVMGQIVGATIQSAGIVDYLTEMQADAKEAKQDALAANIGKLIGWAKGYTAGKPKPTEAEERLTQREQRFNQEQADRDRQEHSRFHTSFVSESRKLQTDIIKAHPALQRVAKTVSPEKLNRITEDIRGRIEKLLGKSPSFMRKLKPAYQGRNLQDTIKLQKAAWSQAWLLNKMVREVLRVETPAMVKNNQDATRRRAGASTGKTPDKTGDKGKGNNDQQPKKNFQSGGRWYRPNGTAFTTAEVLAGKHLL